MALTKITSTNIGANAVTSSAIGYTPANKAGDTFTGNIHIGYDGYPAIKFKNAAGTDKAEMYVGTSAGDLNIVVAGGAAIAIDSSARARMPYQPGFLVRGYQPSSGSSGGNSFMIIASETVDWEVGGGYNKTGGPAGSVRYTAPIVGYYLITWSLMGDASSGSRLIAFINKNGSAITENNSFSSQYNNANTIIVVKLNANDYLDFRFSGPYYTLGNSGHFLGVRLIG